MLLTIQLFNFLSPTPPTTGVSVSPMMTARKEHGVPPPQHSPFLPPKQEAYRQRYVSVPHQQSITSIRIIFLEATSAPILQVRWCKHLTTIRLVIYALTNRQRTMTRNGSLRGTNMMTPRD